MAKERMDGGRGRRPGVVTSAKRGGPGRAFWIALGLVADAVGVPPVQLAVDQESVTWASPAVASRSVWFPGR